MEKNYDIRLNPKRPTSQQIARYKDFDALLRKHTAQTQAKPKPQTAILRRLVYTGIAMAAAIAGLVFFFQVLGNQSYERQSEQYFAAQSHVNPPLENIQPDYAKFAV
ncbi:MAG: hypothetical protein AAB316_18890, partial [Bacteroidota bacterium]